MMRALVAPCLVLALAVAGCDGNPRPSPSGGGDSTTGGDAGDPCEPNPCTTAPAADCASDSERRTYRVPGSCSIVAGQADCAFEPVLVDCSPQVCVAGACEDPTPEVAWCRFQFPTDGAAGAGELFDAYARVYVPGFTDATAGIDVVPGLVADVGWGPDGSDPETSTSWSWTRAQANSTWDALAASEPNNDEYVAQVAESTIGTYDLAARFSVDAGASWTYCDTNAGAGADGSEDGYLAANAGALRITSDPCETNPCTSPPAAVCEDSVTLHQFPNPGTCTSAGGAAQCDYPPLPTDCSQLSQECRDAACAGPAVDWCRMQWPETAAITYGMEVDLFGRVYVAGLTDLTVGNDTDALLVGNAGYGPVDSDPANDGGWTWLPAAANPSWNGGSEGEPNNDEYVATLTGAAEGDYDLAYRFSIDGGSYWTYCDRNAGPGADGSEDGYGVANAATLTVFPPPTIGWCALTFPAAMVSGAGVESGEFYGRVWADGVTNLLGQGPGITAQVGYGDANSDPSADVSWQWSDAAYFGDFGNDDEYRGPLTLTPATAGTYSTAFRFSGDGGSSWAYCDLTDNSIDLDDLGVLTVN